MRPVLFNVLKRRCNIVNVQQAGRQKWWNTNRTSFVSDYWQLNGMSWQAFQKKKIIHKRKSNKLASNKTVNILITGWDASCKKDILMDSAENYLRSIGSFSCFRANVTCVTTTSTLNQAPSPRFNLRVWIVERKYEEPPAIKRIQKMMLTLLFIIKIEYGSTILKSKFWWWQVQSVKIQTSL